MGDFIIIVDDDDDGNDKFTSNVHNDIDEARYKSSEPCGDRCVSWAVQNDDRDY